MARPESGKKSPIGRASSARLAADFSRKRIAARARPPVRAANAAARDRLLLARASAARRSAGAGARGQERRARHLDLPPAPYREAKYARGPGFCCVCGQAVFRFGWHVDLWGAGPNKNANWHCACVIAWQFWNAPSGEARLLRRLQARHCGQNGGRLWKTAEIDHRVPLFRVWGEHRDTPWPALLAYWGLPNLQVINRDAHVAKCANEARDRSVTRARVSMPTP